MPIPTSTGVCKTDLANCKAEIIRQDGVIAAMNNAEAAEDAAEAAEDAAEVIEDQNHAAVVAGLNLALAAAQAANVKNAAVTDAFQVLSTALADAGVQFPLQEAPPST